MGREPPTIDDGHGEHWGPDVRSGRPDGQGCRGPKGKWKAGRDHSLMQRIDYCVTVIGPYEIQRVDDTVLEKITEDLRKRPVLQVSAPDATRKTLSDATKNRYLAAAGVVLTYARKKKLIPRAL
jgi:hypothetical protein